MLVGSREKKSFESAHTFIARNNVRKNNLICMPDMRRRIRVCDRSCDKEFFFHPVRNRSRSFVIPAELFIKIYDNFSYYITVFSNKRPRFRTGFILPSWQFLFLSEYRLQAPSMPRLQEPRGLYREIQRS